MASCTTRYTITILKTATRPGNLANQVYHHNTKKQPIKFNLYSFGQSPRLNAIKCFHNSTINAKNHVVMKQFFVDNTKVAERLFPKQRIQSTLKTCVFFKIISRLRRKTWSDKNKNAGWNCFHNKNVLSRFRIFCSINALFVFVFGSITVIKRCL